MKRNVNAKDVAGRLLNWIKVLHVEENGMRTDAVVQVVVTGISEGNCLDLGEILEGDPKSIVNENVMREFANRVARRLYPGGAYTVEEMSYEVTPAAVTAQLALHLAYP